MYLFICMTSAFPAKHTSVAVQFSLRPATLNFMLHALKHVCYEVLSSYLLLSPKAQQAGLCLSDLVVIFRESNCWKKCIK